jgi:hypothetical protein
VTEPTAADIVSALRGQRFSYATEAQMQDGVEEALRAAGLEIAREVDIGERSGHLSTGCRIDLLVGRVGVELKRDGTALEVARQLRRYLATGSLDGLVLVTARVRHLRCESILRDPRLVVVALPLHQPL